MALTDAVTVHLPLQTSLLKNSTSLELAYDTARMGMRVSIPRRFSKDKKRGNVMAMEASCEVIHMQEPSVKEEKLLSLRSEDMEMIRNRRMMMRTPERQGERKKSRIKITDLPEEVQQNILGFLVGHLGSISSKSSGTGVRNWNYALRHTRGKDRANLALVTPPWTRLIQERLYRHSKYISFDPFL